MKKTIAVIFGGKSPEHEVSIITAIQVMTNMPTAFEVIPIYVTKSGKLITGDYLKSISSYNNMPLLEKMTKQITLPSSPTSITITSTAKSLFHQLKQPFDLIFPCFHGGVGEGGWIQGLAEFYNIPLVGSGLTGSTIGMDKIAMKSIFDGVDIKQAPYLWFYRNDWYAKQATYIKHITTLLKYPIFVKPSRGGSSIGTTYAKTKVELIRAIDLAAAMDTRIVIEEGIMDAREINISIMGNAGSILESSVCEEVFHENSEFLEFKDKYLASENKQGMASTSRTIPAKINKSLSEKIQTTSKLIFNLFDCSGLVRLDYLVKGNDLYCIEINTIPGSLSFYLWDKSGYSFSKLLEHLINLSLIKHDETQKTLTDFPSQLLSNISKGSKLGSKLNQ